MRDSHTDFFNTKTTKVTQMSVRCVGVYSMCDVLYLPVFYDLAAYCARWLLCFKRF